MDRRTDAVRGPRFLRPWRFAAACLDALRGAGLRELEPGDAAYYPSALSHAYENVGEDEAEQQRLASGVRTAGGTLLGLINGVLNYARVETGNVPYELSDAFDIRNPCSNARKCCCGLVVVEIMLERFLVTHRLRRLVRFDRAVVAIRRLPSPDRDPVTGQPFVTRE